MRSVFHLKQVGEPMHGGLMIRQGRKRHRPVTLAQPYDRRSSDLLINAIVAETVVDDPLELGGSLTVMRSLRDDPLAHLHDRKFIDDAQFMAGRSWQAHYERSGIGGVRAIDFTKEAVDGRRFMDALCDMQQAAVNRLARMDKELGQEGCALIRDVLGKGWGLSQCASARGLNHKTGSRDMDYLGRRLRECLDTLAVELGFAGKPRT